MSHQQLRMFSALVGVAYLVGGIIGFIVTGPVTGWAADGSTAILGFEINPFHNLVHLGVGVIFLGATFLSRREALEGVNIAGGAVYLLATVLGFAGGLTALSINAGIVADNFLHLGSGLAPVIVGIYSAASNEARPAGVATA